jgi:hypothetical protein
VPVIAEDLSTPLPVYTSTSTAAGQSCTTKPFSPPGTSLLVAMVACHLQAGTPSITVSDTGGHTWTQKVSVGTNTFSAIYTAPVTSAPGSITVTCSNATAQPGTLGLVVRVDTGANASQGTAATASQLNTGNVSPQLSITSTTAASWVYTCCTGGGPELMVTPVNAATITLDNYQDQNGGSSLLAGKQTAPTGTPGATVLGWTWTVAHTWSIAALEILAADVPVSSSDSGSGNDTTPVAKTTAQLAAQDAGSGAEPRNSGSGTGANGWISSADTGSGNDTTPPASVPKTWLNKGGADTGTGSDAGNGPVSLGVKSADFALGNEYSAVPYTYTPILALVQNFAHEGFSLDRVSALSGSTGAESAQLYAAQQITFSPDLTITDLMADDEEYGSWYMLNRVQLTVVNGYLSFAVIAQLSGTAVASSFGGQSPDWYYGLPMWTQYQHNQPSVPLALRMASRDVNGKTRTLTFVLYKVQLSVLDFTGTVYKNGLQVNYQGTVLFSSYDERGNALSGPEMGRIVSAPGSFAGTAFAPQPFAGV